MSLFESLGQGQGMTQQQALQQIKNDPRGFVQRAGLNVPDGVNDPQQMVTYLINSGQVGGPRLQIARQLMSRMR